MRLFDHVLLAGARLVAAMRLAAKDELGFTVSAGITSNKMLAKLASSRNKPDKQVLWCEWPYRFEVPRVRQCQPLSVPTG